MLFSSSPEEEYEGCIWNGWPINQSNLCVPIGELLINQLNERGGGLLLMFIAVVYYEEETCSFWQKKYTVYICVTSKNIHFNREGYSIYRAFVSSSLHEHAWPKALNQIYSVL